MPPVHPTSTTLMRNPRRSEVSWDRRPSFFPPSCPLLASGQTPEIRRCSPSLDAALSSTNSALMISIKGGREGERWARMTPPRCDSGRPVLSQEGFIGPLPVQWDCPVCLCCNLSRTKTSSPNPTSPQRQQQQRYIAGALPSLHL